MKQQTYIVEKIVLDDQGGSQINIRTDGKSPTIRAEMHGNVPCVIDSSNFVMSDQSQIEKEDDNICNR